MNPMDRTRKRLPVDLGHTAYAAALSIFGCPITWTKVRSVTTDSERTVWHVTPVPAPEHAGIDPEDVLASHRSHRLELEDPYHLFLDAMRGIEARRALAAWSRHGKAARLVDESVPARWMLVEGADDRPSDGGWVRVQGAPLAAALAVLGCRVVRPEPGGLFLVAKRGEPCPDGTRADAADLCQRHADGRLRASDPNHPFLCAWQGAVNYEAMVATARTGVELLLVQSPNPRSTRHAYMPADAPGWRWDRARRFLLGR